MRNFKFITDDWHSKFKTKSNNTGSDLVKYASDHLFRKDIKKRNTDLSRNLEPET